MHIIAGMMKRILIFFLLISLLASCKTRHDNQAVVFGSSKVESGKLARLDALKVSRLIPVDSAKISSGGDFKLVATPEEEGFYLVRIGNLEPISLVLGPADGAELTVDTTSTGISYVVEGNKSSVMLQDYHQKAEATNAVIDSLRHVLLTHRTDKDFAKIKPGIDFALDRALKDLRQFTENLIRRNPGKLASILLINQTFAGQPLFSTSDDAGLFFLVDDSLMAYLPQNSHVKEHHRRMEALHKKIADTKEAEARVGIGKRVPDLKLEDARGHKHSLDEVFGHPAILFFWASWSPESRADMQLLKQLYDQFNKQGLKVFAVSFDHNQKIWKAAIQTEKLEWINVSDPAGLQSPVKQLFSLPDTLPYYYVLDKDGKILEKTGDYSILKKSVEKIMASPAGKPGA